MCKFISSNLFSDSVLSIAPRCCLSHITSHPLIVRVVCDVKPKLHRDDASNLVVSWVQEVSQHRVMIDIALLKKYSFSRQNLSGALSRTIQKSTDSIQITTVRRIYYQILQRTSENAGRRWLIKIKLVSKLLYHGATPVQIPKATESTVQPQEAIRISRDPAYPLLEAERHITSAACPLGEGSDLPSIKSVRLSAIDSFRTSQSTTSSLIIPWTTWPPPRPISSPRH